MKINCTTKLICTWKPLTSLSISMGDMKVVELAVWCPLHLVGYLAHLQFISKIHSTGYDTNLFSGKTNLSMSAEDSKVFTYCHSRLFVGGNSGEKNDPTGLSDMELQHFQDLSKHRPMQVRGKLLLFSSISRTMGAAGAAFEAESWRGRRASFDQRVGAESRGRANKHCFVLGPDERERGEKGGGGPRVKPGGVMAPSESCLFGEGFMQMRIQ